MIVPRCLRDLRLLKTVGIDAEPLVDEIGGAGGI